MDWAASYVHLLTGMSDGCSVEEITTEVAAVACLVVSGVKPPLGVNWWEGEKPEKAIGSRRHVRRYVVTFLLACAYTSGQAGRDLYHEFQPVRRLGRARIQATRSR